MVCLHAKNNFPSTHLRDNYTVSCNYTFYYPYNEI